VKLSADKSPPLFPFTNRLSPILNHLDTQASLIGLAQLTRESYILYTMIQEYFELIEYQFLKKKSIPHPSPF
jgi:hypothetical protein